MWCNSQIIRNTTKRNWLGKMVFYVSDGSLHELGIMLFSMLQKAFGGKVVTQTGFNTGHGDSFADRVYRIMSGCIIGGSFYNADGGCVQNHIWRIRKEHLL